MKNYFSLSLLLCSALLGTSCNSVSDSCGKNAEPLDYATLANPLVGTQSEFVLSAGNTYPAIALPWGMNFWTPQTGRLGDGWQYKYTDHKIVGFKETHQPSPWINDYGQFSLMPMTGEVKTSEADRASWFSHMGEVALPYYYKVYLADYDVVTEITPTERAAIMRFTFPEGDSYIVADAVGENCHIELDIEKQQIRGYSTRNSGGVAEGFKNWFIINFDKPFNYAQVSSEAGDRAKNNSEHAAIGFETKRGEQVHARIASSFISLEQAEINLKELGDNSFDQICETGHRRWNDVLGRASVESDNIDQMRTFYSCLYRATLFPRKFYDIDANGEPIHYSPSTGEICKGYYYTDTGFWDTFRSLFPLLNLLYPSVNKEIQEGLLNCYRESGFFPEWASPGHRGCMVGNNSASVLADAYLKGVCVEDTETLWEGIIHGTNAVHPTVSSSGRLGFDYYNKLGYVPCNVGINESAARTLEYAYDDWCIAQLGKALNRPEEEIAVYEKRSQNYMNLFDPQYNLMRGRNEDGSWPDEFSPLKWGGDFTEGNSWHYTWSVFHNPQGLIDLMGGEDIFVQMLDSVFSVPPLYDESYYGQVIHEIREMTVMNCGNYAHGNQPIQHMVYLYDYAGKPEKTQYWTREVMNRFYRPTPDGYCGDEDNGQTSAWYVFSALGFYPVCPASDQYAIGTPLFPKVTLTFEDGKQMQLSAKGGVEKTPYISNITVNGKRYDKYYFTHSQLQDGGKIVYQMTAQ